MPNPRNNPYRKRPSPDQPAANKAHEWSVNIPFSDLQMLLNQTELMEKMEAENAQLRRELEGLRNMFSDLQVKFGELRRELKGR